MAWLSSLSAGVRPYANKRYILPLLTLFILTLIVLEISPVGAMRLASLNSGQGMLDMRFGYTAESVYSMFGLIGEHGRLLYTQLLGLDYLFTVVYMLLQTLLITALMRKAGVHERFKLLNLIPLLRCLLDLLENTLLYFLLISYPVENGSLVNFCSIVTMVKLSLNYGYMGMMFLLGALSTRGIMTVALKAHTGKVEESV
jgi:hypothetical protein